MKKLKSTCLSLLLLVGTLFCSHAQSFRTDINPALLYYQSFILGADLSQADHDYLLTNQWQGLKLPARFGELVGESDNKFKLIRQAAHSSAPCDWGIDWSAGPDTFLPQLGRSKATVQMARLRAMWDLQNNRQAEARDDLLAAFTLARNCSRDNSLIAVLVQIAAENIVCSTVAENFDRFSPETLQQLADGFDAAPARGTMANSFATTEVRLFYDWVEARITQLRQEYPGNDAQVLDSFRYVFENNGDGGQKDTNIWPRIVKAAGGTSEGFLALVQQTKPLQARLTAIASLPQPEYDNQIQQFDAEVQQSTNPLVSCLFPALDKARPREFAILAELAMVRAAVEYKVQGEAGLKSVKDPFGSGPFEFQWFKFNGMDRGFELKSAYHGRGFPEVMIFVEKEGPPFYVNGRNAGKAVTP
jgi:hypothetical protein